MIKAVVVSIPVPGKVNSFYGKRREIARKLKAGIPFLPPQKRGTEEWIINLQCFEKDLQLLKRVSDKEFYDVFLDHLHSEVKRFLFVVDEQVSFRVAGVGIVPGCGGMILYRVVNHLGELIIPKYCRDRFIGHEIACIRRVTPAPMRMVA